MTSKAETQARLMESYGWQDAADEPRRLESEIAEFQQVGWAISYDGKTPYQLWFAGDGDLLDLEVKRQGGTACKMALYAKVEK